MTIDYIVAQNLIGKANDLALLHGASATEDALPRAYLFTRHTDDATFRVKRCDWDGGSLIEIKEDNHVRFIAVPLDPYDTPNGPVVRHRGQRYQIEEYVPGVWTTTLAREHTRLCGRPR